MPLTVNRVGSMLTAFFCPGPVVDYASARHADTARYARFFQAMLERGVYLAPSQFEAAFVSLAHSEADLDAARARGGGGARDPRVRRVVVDACPGPSDMVHEHFPIPRRTVDCRCGRQAWERRPSSSSQC